MKVIKTIYLYGSRTQGGFYISVDAQGARLYHRENTITLASGEVHQERCEDRVSVHRKTSAARAAEGFSIVTSEMENAQTLFKRLSDIWIAFYGPMNEFMDDTRREHLELRTVEHDGVIKHACINTHYATSNGRRAFGEIRPRPPGVRNPERYAEETYVIEYARQTLADLLR
jgi:hypothetical protein